MALILPAFDQDGSHHLGAPFALLNGFALELAFKAVLQARGSSDKELRRFSHNLRAAHDEVVQRGIRWTDTEAVDRLVETMTGPHARHELRYIPANVDAISLPRPAVAYVVTTQLLDDIEVQEPRIFAEMPG